MNIESAIKKCGWKYAVSNNVINLCCPLAPWTHEKKVDSHPSAQIKEGKFYCFCCGESYENWLLFDSLWLRTGDNKYRELSAALFSDEPEVDVDRIWEDPQEKILLPYPKLFYQLFEDLPPRADEYLIKRGLTLDVIKQYGLKYDSDYDRVVFPCFIKGELYGAQGRAMSPTVQPKYFNYWNFKKNLLLGGLDNLIPRATMTFVFEGWPGMLRFKSFFPEVNVLCSYGSTLSHPQASTLSSLDSRVILCYDNDEAGFAGARKAINKYGQTLDILSVTFPDDIDCLNQETLRKELKEKNLNV